MGLILKTYKEHIKINSKKHSIFKWTEDLNRHFFSKTSEWPTMKHKKRLNTTNHQGTANQNCNEILPHTCQNGYHQKIRNNKYWREKENLEHCWWECNCSLPVRYTGGEARSAVHNWA